MIGRVIHRAPPLLPARPRRRLSGSAALATLGDGWTACEQMWPQGPFGREPEASPAPLRHAEAAVVRVQRGAR